MHVHAPRLWSVHGALLQTMLHHSEFTYGVDFNLHQPGEVSSLQWCHGVTRQMVSYSTHLNAFVLHHSKYILSTVYIHAVYIHPVQTNSYNIIVTLLALL